VPAAYERETLRTEAAGTLDSVRAMHAQGTAALQTELTERCVRPTHQYLTTSIPQQG
jgi:hypothetical protein